MNEIRHWQCRFCVLREVRKQHAEFVIADDSPWGKICARAGCMPSKALIKAANTFYHRNTFTEFRLSWETSI